MYPINFLKKELRTLHLAFGELLTRALNMLLNRASCSKIDQNRSELMENIKENYAIYRNTATAPRKLKLTIGTARLQLNHNVLVDTMFVHSRAVIMMRNEAKHFFVAFFIQNCATEVIWARIPYVYCGLLLIWAYQNTFKLIIEWLKIPKNRRSSRKQTAYSWRRH